MRKLGLNNDSASQLYTNATEFPVDLLNKVRIQRMTDREAKDSGSFVPRLRKNRMLHKGNELLSLAALSQALDDMLQSYTQAPALLEAASAAASTSSDAAVPTTDATSTSSNSSSSSSGSSDSSAAPTPSPPSARDLFVNEQIRTLRAGEQAILRHHLALLEAAMRQATESDE